GEQAASGRLLERVTTLLEDSYYDIIHCHFGQNGLRGQMLRELGAIRGKLVTSFYGQDLTEYQQKKGPHIYQRLFAQGEKFIVISDFLKQRAIESGCPSEKLVKLPLGVDITRYQFVPRKLGPGDSVQLLTVARLVEKKGIEFSIRAVASV